MAQKVVLGEGKEGIIYRTDAAPDIAERVETIEIPGEYNVPTLPHAIVLKDATNLRLAPDYLDLMLTSEGQEVMQRFNDEPVQ